MDATGIVAIIAGMGTLAFFIVAMRRLIAAFLLHRSINLALRQDPASVAELTKALPAAPGTPTALPGWLLLTAATVLLVIALFADNADRRDGIEATAIVAVLGVAWLLIARQLERRSAQAISADASTA